MAESAFLASTCFVIYILIGLILIYIISTTVDMYNNNSKTKNFDSNYYCLSILELGLSILLIVTWILFLIDLRFVGLLIVLLGIEIGFFALSHYLSGSIGTLHIYLIFTCCIEIFLGVFFLLSSRASFLSEQLEKLEMM